MNQLNALIFLQAKIFVRSSAAIGKSWQRTLLWVLNFVIIVLVSAVWFHAPTDLNNWSPPFTTISCLVVFLLSLGMALEMAFGFGHSRRVLDDGLFLISLGIDSRLEDLRCRLSSLFAALMTYGFRSLPFAIFLLPHTDAAAALIRLAALFVAILGLLTILPLSFSLWRLQFPETLRVLSLIPFLIALTSLVALISPLLDNVRVIEDRLCNAYVTTMPPLFWIVLALLVVAIWSALKSPFAANEHSASNEAIESNEIRTAAPAQTYLDTALLGEKRLRGAWTEIWKDRTISSRFGSKSFPSVIIIGLTIGIVGGLISRNSDPQVAWLMGFLLANGLIIFNASLATRVAEDISQPLWWLSCDSIAYRLSIRALTGSAPQCTVIIVTTVAFFAVVQPMYIGEAAASAAAMVLLSASIGAAVYVAFPSPIDVRGPGWLFRIASTYALALAALVLPITIVSRFNSTLTNYLAPLLLIAESVALHWFAIRMASQDPERLI